MITINIIITFFLYVLRFNCRRNILWQATFNYLGKPSQRPTVDLEFENIALSQES